VPKNRMSSQERKNKPGCRFGCDRFSMKKKTLGTSSKGSKKIQPKKRGYSPCIGETFTLKFERHIRKTRAKTIKRKRTRGASTLVKKKDSGISVKGKISHKKEERVSQKDRNLGQDVNPRIQKKKKKKTSEREFPESQGKT